MSTPASQRPEAFHFPNLVSFQKKWRTYQERVLSALDLYLLDRRVHIVAAPGSGKTVLGLEIVRRLDRPTLILAPTLTIRDQWVERFVELFLPDRHTRPEWISNDLRHPGFLTVSTYQALHSVCTGSEEDEPQNGTPEAADNHDPDELPHKQMHWPPELAGAAFRTLVLDEAHHLRTEWWKVLTAAVERLQDPIIVALTATPPYDVAPFEWERYQELCGPVDAEVSVPELVQHGDLCPHQDYVYFTAPAPRELDAMMKYREGVERIFQQISSSEEFGTSVEIHPWLLKPEAYAEDILSNPSYTSSLVIFLHHVDRPLPKPVLEILGVTEKKLPAFDLEWAEILLTGCLYADAGNFISCAHVLKPIKQSLQQIDAIERRRVTLRFPSSISKLLSTSITKMDAVAEIVKLESASLGTDLRLVVLTDFIRKADLPRNNHDPAAFDDIGVVPIFEKLRRETVSGVRLGVLSGSLIIVPTSTEGRVREIACEIGLATEDVSLSPISHDPNYLALSIRGDAHQSSVRLVTHLFEEGGIAALVGTKSLLGEGWDAPCINTLVLASFVGSYMLSNQMRGRSIRTFAAHPGKTANIWHLVCIDPGIGGPGDDYESLCRRFKAFAGVSFKHPAIESGIGRLDLGDGRFTRESIVAINEGMRQRALDRDGLRQRWNAALGSGVRMIEAVSTPELSLPRRMVFNNTIAAVWLEAAAIGIAILVNGLEGLRGFRNASLKGLLEYVAIVLVIAAIVSLPFLLKALWLFIKHGSLESSLFQVGDTVLQSLLYAGVITTPKSKLLVRTAKDAGSVVCWLEGSTSHESSVFLRTIHELLDPVENCRYLLSRSRKYLFFLREDYHAVPEVIGRKKEFAEHFARLWRKKVGSVDLIYTRTAEGRKLLLRARGKSLSATFQPKSERVSCWK